MAQKRRWLDIWLVDTNTIYREVPFAVVADWVQQGRLLSEDKLRPSGTAEWFRVGSVPAFAAYLPKADPNRAEDQAEALERVEVGFGWKRRPEDADDDVDMIPLIDISLVLLIFFIMTTASIFYPIPIPESTASTQEPREKTVFVEIDLKMENGEPVLDSAGQKIPNYNWGPRTASERVPWDTPAPMLRDLEREIRARVDDNLKRGIKEPLEVRIRAHKKLPFAVIKNMTYELNKIHIQMKKEKGIPDQEKLIRVAGEVGVAK